MTAGVWCLRCGREASLVAESLDPEHPLVTCYVRPDGSGCGRQIGTRIEAEAEAAVRRFGSRQATARHREHLRAGAHDPDCYACRAALARLRPTRGIR